MAVFDDMERADPSAHAYGEPDFDYLNRSPRVEADRVRQLIETWAGHYPSSHRGGLFSRLRSRIDGMHRSAFFELMLHELLISHGAEVIALEPRVPGTTRNPDFLAKTADGEEFYLEAVFARGMSDEEVAAQHRLDAVLRAIDEMPSPTHFLDLRATDTPKSNVNLKDLRRKLRGWIEKLPHGDASKDAAPFEYSHDGLTVRLTAWPRSKPGGRGRSIGVRHFGASTVTRADDIASAIQFKASRYGKQLGRPLLVAVSSFETFRHDEDVLDVLLGTEIVQVVTRGPERNRISLARQPDGIWHGPNGPRASRLSGVLWFKQIDAWNFAPRDPLIVSNPWAELPAPALKLIVSMLLFGHVPWWRNGDATDCKPVYPGSTPGLGSSFTSGEKA